jgi:hypothetical protein
VVFNTVAKAELGCRAALDLCDCAASLKQAEVKLGRLSKYYTFTELMRELSQT